MRHFFVAPLVAADDGNAEHFCLRRLYQQENRLLVGAAGTARVLVDNHFALRLCRNGCGHCKKQKKRRSCTLGTKQDVKLLSEKAPFENRRSLPYFAPGVGRVISSTNSL